MWNIETVARTLGQDGWLLCGSPGVLRLASTLPHAGTPGLEAVLCGYGHK